MFICFYPKRDSGAKEDSARFVIRADEMGQDVAGPVIPKGDCWYTLGMSFGANGQVNYLCQRRRREFLRRKTDVASCFTTAITPRRSKSFFFDLVNMD